MPCIGLMPSPRTCTSSAFARVIAFRSGFPAEWKRRSSFWRARAWAMCAIRRSIATTPAARSLRFWSAPVRWRSSGSRDTGRMRDKNDIFSMIGSLPKLKKVYRARSARTPALRPRSGAAFRTAVRRADSDAAVLHRSRPHRVPGLHVRHHRAAERRDAFGQYDPRQQPGHGEGLELRSEHDRLFLQSTEPQYRHRRACRRHRGGRGGGRAHAVRCGAHVRPRGGDCERRFFWACRPTPSIFSPKFAGAA